MFIAEGAQASAGGSVLGAPHRGCSDVVFETDAGHSSLILGVLHTGGTLAGWMGSADVSHEFLEHSVLQVP